MSTKAIKETAQAIADLIAELQGMEEIAQDMLSEGACDGMEELTEQLECQAGTIATIVENLK